MKVEPRVFDVGTRGLNVWPRGVTVGLSDFNVGPRGLRVGQGSLAGIGRPAAGQKNNSLTTLCTQGNSLTTL